MSHPDRRLDQAEEAQIRGHELLPDSPQAIALLKTVEARFNALPSDAELLKEINWADVERSLRESPEDLYSLHIMEETGGEPQLIGIVDGEFIFEDRSKQSPNINRRGLTFQEADDQRKTFGPHVNFQDESAYRQMQDTGLYDEYSFSWLATSDETRRAARALIGRRASPLLDEPDVHLKEVSGDARSGYTGWRASLRVKKV